MTVELDALVLPAFDDLRDLSGETAPWERMYDFTERASIPGVNTPLQYTPGGLGMVPTGVGKTAAASTVTALLASESVDLSEALICTVGVAGAPPDLGIGSVVISETVVDWDLKCRFDDPDEDDPIARYPHTNGQGIFHLDSELVEWALSRAETVELEQSADATETPEADVLVGTNLCGDELWHGSELATQAEWFVEQHDCSPYCVTEMEDAGTAMALSRFGQVDDYLAIRGVSNYDRPLTELSPRENFFSDGFDDSYEVGIENAAAVGQAVVSERLD